MGGLGRRHMAGEGDRDDAVALCQAIMAAASVLGPLVLLVGICAARAGARGSIVVIMLLYYWLAWPLGALCCGVVALGAALGASRRDGERPC